MTEEFQRVSRLPPYVFSIVSDLRSKARRRGEDIIDFGMGNPDQPTPQHIVDKLCETVARSDTHRYSTSRGIPRLRQAIAGWYRQKFDVEIDPETEAIVTIGSKEGLAHLALAVLSPGDMVVVPNPAYPIHPYSCVIAGAELNYVPMDDEEEFLNSLQQTIENCWPRPKMLLLNFPCNPTGHCVGLDFYAKVVDIAQEYKLWVVQDIAYAELAFDGYVVPSILQVKGAKDVAVEFYTLSKSYNMPGWRVGFMCGNARLVSALSQNQVLRGLWAVHSGSGGRHRRIGRTPGLCPRNLPDVPGAPGCAVRRAERDGVARGRSHPRPCSCGRRFRKPARTWALLNSARCS